MRRRVKWALLIPAVILAGIQFARPGGRTNPPEDYSKTIFAEPAVWQDAPQSIERACLDCYSSRTRWPWYSNVAPVSRLVVRDVANGREHMDLSDWAAYDDLQKAALLQDVCKLVKRGAMPLPIYMPMHREAKLTDKERQEICAWAERARARLNASAK